jgi:hypothetical protein
MNWWNNIYIYICIYIYIGFVRTRYGKLQVMWNGVTAYKTKPYVERSYERKTLRSVSCIYLTEIGQKRRIF